MAKSEIRIIETSKELTRAEAYQLTLSPAIQKMSEQEGQIIEVSQWCIYSDLDSNGKEQELLSILTPENEVFATNSQTFSTDFMYMLEFFGEAGVRAIKVISGTSKAGRKFITCAYER